MKQPKPKKTPHIFTITATNEGYSHLSIRVMEPRPWDSDDHRELLEITWQANAETRHEWYATHVKCDHGQMDYNLPDRMMRAAKLAGKLFDNNVSGTDPEKVITDLQALGFQRAAYDRRVSRYVTEAEAIDPRLIRFMDNWDAYEAGRDGCTTAVLALDEADAQDKMTREWGERIARGATDGHRFAAWLQAGRPVREDGWNTKPATYPPIAELLNRPTEITAAA